METRKGRMPTRWRSPGGAVSGIMAGDLVFDDTANSILVVLPTWVGDLVMSTPALRSLRQRFWRASIVYLAEPNLRDLVVPLIGEDSVEFWPEKGEGRFWSSSARSLSRRLRSRRFDLAVLFPNSFRSAWAAYRAGALRRVGFDRDGRRWLLTDPVRVPNRRRRGATAAKVSRYGTPTGAAPDRGVGRYFPTPLVDYYSALVEHLGCDSPGDQLELVVDRSDAAWVQSRFGGLPRPHVVLAPGAKYGAAKCWPADRFAQLAHRLIREHGATVFSACGPGEEPLAAAIRAAFPANQAAKPARDETSNLSSRFLILDDPKLTLGQTQALIQQCDLLIGNDAGLRHVAKAFGRPVVAIFGPTHPDWTATKYEHERILRIDVECGPCQQRQCPLGHLQCMTGISIDQVFRAAEELLRGAHRARP